MPSWRNDRRHQMQADDVRSIIAPQSQGVQIGHRNRQKNKFIIQTVLGDRDAAG